MTVLAPSNGGLPPIQEEPDNGTVMRQVHFWKSRIESARKLNSYQNQKETKEEARAFYQGKQITDQETADWEGDIVKANLFRRTVNFMVDSVYAQDPKIRVAPMPKVATDPMKQNNASALETHLVYTFDEESQGAEVRRVWKDAYFGNLSAAKIDFDRKRGLWRGKWVAGELICDPDAHGDLSRARWLAERVELPSYRVWQDATFDPIARKEIKEKQGRQGEMQYQDTNGAGGGRDMEVLWYIYTKEGIDPFNFSEDASTPDTLRLLVVAENYDKWLLNIENPCPYLDEDEFPYSIIRLDELPGEFIGPALWETIKPVCRSFNWAASYHMADMRKSAGAALGYDQNKIADPGQLKSRKARVLIPIDGAVGQDVLQPLDIGQSDKTIFESVQFFYGLLDKLTGIDEIARGEEGRTKTATESQILQQNSNITMRGPGVALDNFLNDLVRKIALASLYYTPAFSKYTDQTGNVITKQVVPVPTPGPMMQGPQGPMPGPMQMVPTPMPVLTGEQGPPGQYIVKGIDYYHGDQVAMNWPQVPFEEIKCDLAFRIEAGSSRLEMRNEKRQTALSLLQTVGAEYKLMGAFGQYYEILAQVIESHDLDNMDKILMPKEEFIALQQQAMMMQQMAAMQQQQGPPGKEKGSSKGGDGPGNANPGTFNKGKNEGKKFPMTESSGV